MNKCHSNTELSSHEETRSEFNPGKTAIKLGIDVHQEFYVVVMQIGGSNPKPAQRFSKAAFLSWAARLKQKSGAEIHAMSHPRLTTYIGVRPLAVHPICKRHIKSLQGSSR